MGKTGLKFVVGRSPIIKGPAARGGSVFFSRHAGSRSRQRTATVSPATSFGSGSAGCAELFRPSVSLIGGMIATGLATLHEDQRHGSHKVTRLMRTSEHCRGTLRIG